MYTAENAVSTYRALFRDAPFRVVSNREPYVPGFDESGALTWSRPAGGLTAALDPVVRAVGGTWIAWATPVGGKPRREGDPPRAPERLRLPPEDPAYDVRRVRLSENEVRNYYHGYANESLWPLCHNLLEYVRFRDRFWRAYVDVNRKFADAVVEETDDPRALIWLQDYHLALAPLAIRRLRPESRLAQFWHIPWPAPELFRVCPNHRSLLEGLLANDLLAFHLESHCDNFIRSCETTLDVLVDWKRRAVIHDGHVTSLRALPISIDAEAMRLLAREPSTEQRMEELRRRHGLQDLFVGIGVDRVDYSKGIVERLDALRILFQRHPEWRGRFTFVQVGSPSRTEIPAYAELQRRIDVAVERLNRAFERDGWKPVLYISTGLPQEDVAAFYRLADVAVVSSLQDGMNLVAKEFVAAQVDRRGVLCLSEFAGAAEEFEHAIAINPFYTEGFAEDIHRALRMPADERRARMERMQAKLEEGNVFRWISDVFTAARRSLDRGGRRRARERRRFTELPSAQSA